MPKTTKYPRLRTKFYRGAGGQGYTYYVYDMRGSGQPDVRLGKDYGEAIRRWDELHNQKPRQAGTVREAIVEWRNEVLPTYESGETRKGYKRQIGRIEAVFGGMYWEEIDLPMLRQYLRRRTAKTQGNREMSVFQIVWGYALLEGMTRTPWPAAGVKGWKNEEHGRLFEVTNQIFDAIYAEGDRILRDAMDITTSTGMRLTDARTVRMPAEGLLRFRSNKRGKWAEFAVADSPTLTALIERRGTVESTLLLTTPTGREVTQNMLRSRYEAARESAAAKAEKTGQDELAAAIRAMYLRDCRKRAADLASDEDEATKLLQHSSKKTTQEHYRTRPTRLRAVR